MDQTENTKFFKIRWNFQGTLEDGTEFDSSRARNQEFMFTLGMGQVIKVLKIENFKRSSISTEKLKKKTSQ